MKPKILVLPPKNVRKIIMEEKTIKDLKQFAEVVINEGDSNYTEEELYNIIPEFDGAITSWGSPKFTEKVLKNAKNLKIISHAAGSVKAYISPLAWEKKIVITNAADAISYSVAELTILFILASLRKIINVDKAMKNGLTWKDKKDRGGWELRNKTVGIIGMGSVARIVTDYLTPFKTNIICYDPYLSDKEAVNLGIKKVSLNYLLCNSKIITVHAPSIPETYHMLGEKELALIKDDAVLVNTARGSIIDENVLIEELKKERFVAALDVYENEPLAVESELRNLSNVIITPHVAGLTYDCRYRVSEYAVEDQKRFFNGQKPYRVITKEMLSTIA